MTTFKEQMEMDLDVFFNLDEFADPVSYYDGTATTPVKGIVDFGGTGFDKQAKTEYIPGEKGDYVLVAGWELPMSWVENGPPDKGWLHVYYYSGRDDGNKEEWDPKLKRKVRQTDCTGKLVGRWGCAPVWDLRKKLTKNCLCGNKT